MLPFPVACVIRPGQFLAHPTLAQSASGDVVEKQVCQGDSVRNDATIARCLIQLLGRWRNDLRLTSLISQDATA